MINKGMFEDDKNFANNEMFLEITDGISDLKISIIELWKHVNMLTCKNIEHSSYNQK